jgi:hypothetical protein
MNQGNCPIDGDLFHVALCPIDDKTAIRGKRRITNVAIAGINSGNLNRCRLTNRVHEQGATALSGLSDIHDPLSVRRNVQLTAKPRPAVQVSSRNVEGHIGGTLQLGRRLRSWYQEANRD